MDSFTNTVIPTGGPNITNQGISYVSNISLIQNLNSTLLIKTPIQKQVQSTSVSSIQPQITYKQTQQNRNVRIS